MAIESMKSGAHAFVEVPIATNIKYLWNIVDTSDETILEVIGSPRVRVSAATCIMDLPL